jgi:hypothetical protein
MIVVRVELWSAITGAKTEIARMHIANDGTGTEGVGNYTGVVFRGRSSSSLDAEAEGRSGRVVGHRRKTEHVWALVAKMLSAMGYPNRRGQ